MQNKHNTTQKAQKLTMFDTVQGKHFLCPIQNPVLCEIQLWCLSQILQQSELHVVTLAKLYQTPETGNVWQRFSVSTLLSSKEQKSSFGSWIISAPSGPLHITSKQPTKLLQQLVFRVRQQVFPFRISLLWGEFHLITPPSLPFLPFLISVKLQLNKNVKLMSSHIPTPTKRTGYGSLKQYCCFLRYKWFPAYFNISCK